MYKKESVWERVRVHVRVCVVVVMVVVISPLLPFVLLTDLKVKQAELKTHRSHKTFFFFSKRIKVEIPNEHYKQTIENS